MTHPASYMRQTYNSHRRNERAFWEGMIYHAQKCIAAGEGTPEQRAAWQQQIEDAARELQRMDDADTREAYSGYQGAE